jgi:hypothetical protein
LIVGAFEDEEVFFDEELEELEELEDEPPE